MNKKIVSIVLTLAIIFGFQSYVFADENDGSAKDKESVEKETVEILSIDDFIEFSENCCESEYTLNKIFELKCDINLSTTDFEPIGYFQGEFKGNNHKITNLNVTASGSRLGLFRTIGENGTVGYLSVSGKINPDGSQVYIGGIAGENFGTIKNCSFEGSVEGIESVGGIAGVNYENASIINCKTGGSAQGEHSVGGIVGYSLGTVSGCKNKMSVNTVSFTPKSEFSFDISSISQKDFLDITDIGGIAGLSTGSIYSSINYGTVGYQYVGYNIGGIAGRSDGFISKCENRGEIHGRKDIGGIAGQHTPYTDLSFDETKQQEMTASLNNLNEQIDVATQNTKESASDINAEIENNRDVSYRLSDAITNYINNPTSDPSELTQAINDFSAAYSQMQSLTASTATVASTELERIGNAMKVVYSSLAEFINITLIDVEDISLEKGYENDKGAIDASNNYGDIYGESCTGGISGNVGYEVSFDMEDTLTDNDISVKEARGYIFAVIRNCNSFGNVECKSDYSGAIAGNMKIGAVLDSTAAGNITSRTGNYVGGIAGRCDGTIKNCCSRAALSGNKYVGGISGEVLDILDCISFVSFDSYQEYAGAVSGWVDGEASNNLFVKVKPYGIDGVSYTNKTKAIDYKDLALIENISPIFSEIEVSFIGPDGKVLEKQNIGFGETLQDLPEVPMNGNQYWKWDVEDIDRIYYSTQINGSYHNEITTLSTGEELANFLAEGNFFDNQYLNVYDYSDSRFEDVMISKTVEVNDYSGQLKVRMLCEEDGKLYLINDDGTYDSCSYSSDGRYKVFTLNNGQSFVYVKNTASIVGPKIAFGSILLLSAAGAFIFIKKRKKSTKTDNQTVDNLEK